MSVAFFALVILLGSSMVVAFVLHPSQEEPPAVATCGGRPNSCHGDCLQSIRMALLSALNLQAEPRLPVGGLTAIREQWKTSFTTIAHKGMEDRAIKDVTPGTGNSAGLKCCQMTSHISLTDLGWDNWVIYPESFTFVQCVARSPPVNTDIAHRLSHIPVVQGHTEQGPCCLLTAKEMVPILYMDELSTLVISSVAMTRSCGCGPEHP